MLNYLETILLEHSEFNKKLTSSLVMNYLENQLNLFKESELSPEEDLKRKHLIRLVKLIAYIPIEDSHNLKKIYDMFSVKLLTQDFI